MNTLESGDYKILKYISRYKRVHINKTLKKFPESRFSTSYRLNRLVTDKNAGRINMKDASYIVAIYDFTNEDSIEPYVHTGEYEITGLGRAELQDNKSRSFKFWLREFVRSIFFPMIVAFLTTIFTIWIASLVQQP